MYPTVRTFYTLALLMCATHELHAESQACLQVEPTSPRFVTTAPEWYYDNLADCAWDNTTPDVRGFYGSLMQAQLLNEIRAHALAEQLCFALIASNNKDTEEHSIIYCKSAHVLSMSAERLVDIIDKALAPWIAE